MEGGGVPPFSVNFFPLTFRQNLVRGGPGGVPPQRKVSVPGVFEPFPKLPLSSLRRIVVFRSDKLEEIIGEVKRSFPGGVTA